MNTPPTRRQIDEMNRVQDEKRAENDALGPRPQNCGQSYCSCIECPYPPRRAGTCITPSQGAPE